MRGNTFAGILLLATTSACASGNDKSGGDPQADATTSDSSSNVDSTTSDGFSPDANETGFDGACATAEYIAKQDPAAMLFVLDRSHAMTNGDKWSGAGAAIVTAIDLDGFDGMSLGLLASPATGVSAPDCLTGGIPLPITVMCGNPAVPQVAVANAGTNKSSASSGVRHNIYQWLATNGADPDPGSGSGTPLYGALKQAYNFIRLASVPGKRLVAFVVNGAASCTSVASPSRPGYDDANHCPDWEYPDNLITLIKAAHDDATAPVSTFVVGVPGADTTGASPATEPPYHLKRALSAYALAGSPETAPAGCDGAWSKSGGDPTLSCHFDMTSGTLDAKALADNIAHIRGAALGCVYEVPKPTDGSTVDKNKVNVEIVATSPPSSDSLKRRSAPSDTCATDGCWDYTSEGKIELLGKACDDAKKLTSGSVKIVVGCATIIK